MTKKFFSKLNGFFVKDEDGRKAENISIQSEDTYVPLPDNVRDAIITLANHFASVDSSIESKANAADVNTAIANLSLTVDGKADEIHTHSAAQIGLNPPMLYNGQTYTSLIEYLQAIASN